MEACEDLIQGCTAKGRKEGSGGRVLRVMVAISYGKGVIECSTNDNLDSRSFASFIKRGGAVFFHKDHGEGWSKG